MNNIFLEKTKHTHEYGRTDEFCVDDLTSSITRFYNATSTHRTKTNIFTDYIQPWHGRQSSLPNWSPHHWQPCSTDDRSIGHRCSRLLSMGLWLVFAYQIAAIWDHCVWTAFLMSLIPMHSCIFILGSFLIAFLSAMFAYYIYIIWWLKLERYV